MLNRILRLLAAGLNAYSFYSNPIRFLATLIAIILIPYLAYILWGAALIIVLAIAGLYFIYKTVRSSIENRSSYY